MEVAGVILGAIPVALYALDNYRRCLRVTKDIVKYEATITTFRHHIFIQKKQLEVTLRNVGLQIFDSRLPTRTELQRHLSARYSKKDCEQFMGIIDEMEKIMDQLLHKLDLDAMGKPRWDKGAQDRISWQWRRVRRGLGSSAREELVKQLQYWNTALCYVFEKPEIPSDADGLLVQKLQSQFSHNICNHVRSSLHGIHEALTQTDQSHVPHLSTLQVPFPTGAWRCLTIRPKRLEDYIQAQEKPSPIDESATDPFSIGSSDANNKNRVKISWRAKGPLDFIKSLALNAALPNPTTPLIPKPAACKAPAANPPEVTCLCEFIGRDHGQERTEATLQPLEQCIGHRGHFILTCTELLPTSRNLEPSQSLMDLLGPPNSLGPSKPLSRKDRLAIAAATTWAALYLCGTPWLPEDSDWGGLRTLALAHSIPDSPAISCVLKPSESRPPSSPSPTLPHNDGIRNRVVFRLGILLTELCLNTTLDTLRSTRPEYRTMTDYELAASLSDSIYLDAGHSFGYAVQRCLRCEFPGRDSTKRLEIEQFRNVFFNGVVAPVQAVYLLQSS
ncbi:hypothetical protein B0T14DRAFT_564048 [Immersiella caudata]|uniref:DUF7580 domain-containing protein n=1 Tax=Immersiella caudata TaxID=314043 RepID=A0AA39WWL4_9PEZI|nr:hypothetical protein B0T14DRAFT_564048 [Immersiella caudata]